MNKLFINTLVLLSAAALVAGCSNESDSSTSVVPSDVQGEPIQRLAATETVPESPLEEPVGLPIADTGATPAEADEGSSVADETVAVVADTVEPESASREIIQSGGRDYLSVGFDHLASYEFEVTDELLEAEGDFAELTKKTNGMIPEEVRKLNASSVAVKGYMLPLKVEEGQVTEFLLMRDQSMCCFGTVPKINEWVSVKTIGSGVKPIMDEPVTIFGKLHVGEIRENGYLVGIYRMDGEKLAGPLDL